MKVSARDLLRNRAAEIDEIDLGLGVDDRDTDALLSELRQAVRLGKRIPPRLARGLEEAIGKIIDAICNNGPDPDPAVTSVLASHTRRLLIAELDTLGTLRKRVHEGYVWRAEAAATVEKMPPAPLDDVAPSPSFLIAKSPRRSTAPPTAISLILSGMDFAA